MYIELIIPLIVIAVLLVAVVLLAVKVQKLLTENAGLEAEKKSFEAFRAEDEKLRDAAKQEFENLANKLLDAKSEKFTELNKTNIKGILDPLEKEIESFRKKVEDVYDKESKDRARLGQEVKSLTEKTELVSTEANNLAQALKGQAKKQGDWGEMILERVLEITGLARGRDYDVQHSFRNEDGDSQRPDVVINLPEERKLIVDSKVALTAYERYASAESDEEREQHLADHIKAVSSHIDQLGAKKYDEMEGSLDFVMMFVPIEPAYLLAIREKPELWDRAYSNRVILTSPTNLIAAIKLIDDLWKREKQSRNVLEIANRGKLLYEKFVGFLGNLEDIGKHLDKSQQSYNNAMGQLKTGRGNLVSQAEQLKDLGVNTKKSLPSAMEDYEDDSPPAVELLSE